MAGKKKDGGSDAVLTFRLPRALHERLVGVSAGRSVSEEMRRRLEGSFSPSVGSEDPRFRDLLIAIGHAAAAAAKMPYKPEVPYRTVEGGPVRRDDDKTPYVAFREAVVSLMDAFEPKGPRIASDETLIRLTDQLVGLALGALGDRGLAAFTNRARVGEEPRFALHDEPAVPCPTDRSGAPAHAMAHKNRKRDHKGGA
jgi:hypothetical protein